jgi:hypothetical protein
LPGIGQNLDLPLVVIGRDIAILGLQRAGLCVDLDGCVCAQSQLRVGCARLPNRDCNGLFPWLETAGNDAQVVASRGNIIEVINPFGLVLVLKFNEVAGFCSETVAFGTTALLGSTTTPVTYPEMADYANRLRVLARKAVGTEVNNVCRMLPPMSVFFDSCSLTETPTVQA